jgi:predicted phage tail protein
MLLIGLCALSMAPTCGKRRPPLPPIERVPQRTEELTGVQRGNQVILMWPAPLRNAGSGSVQSIRRVDVYRVAEKPSAPLALTEDQFAAKALLVGSVPFDEIRKGAPTLTYVDTLELAGQPARLRYAVRYVNAAGQRAAFSNFFLMEPAAKVAKSPANVTKQESETAISLSWKAPSANVDESTPANLLGYNIYRIDPAKPEAEARPLNKEPVTATHYEDRTFKFGQKYHYFVRSVSLGTEAKPVESFDSNQVDAAPTDHYPPAPPSLAQPTSIPGSIALFWGTNSEPDIAGYLLFRSTDPNAAKPWTQLTTEVSLKTTFTDSNVETGKTYYYYVIALDNAGNKSNPSNVVSETVP